MTSTIGDAKRPACFYHPADRDVPVPTAGYWTDVRWSRPRVRASSRASGCRSRRSRASARVALMTAETERHATARPGRPDCDLLCRRDIWDSGGVARVHAEPVNGRQTHWIGTAPTVPRTTSDVSVSISVGCGRTRTTYSNMAYVTRVLAGRLRALTDARDRADQPRAAERNPYFIPRDGAPCQMT